MHSVLSRIVRSMVAHTRYIHALPCLFLAGFLSNNNAIHAQTLEEEATRLWKNYGLIHADSNRQAIDTLQHISIAYKLLGLPRKSDSAAQLFLQRAKISDDPSLLINAVNDWINAQITFEFVPASFIDSNRATILIGDALSTAKHKADNKLLSKAWQASANMRMGNGEFETALLEANKGYYYASLAADPDVQIPGHLLVGACDYKLNNKLEAFRQYMDALYLAQSGNNISALIKVYEYLFLFCDGIKNYEKAEQYLYKILPLVVKGYPMDSDKIMYHYVNLALLQCKRHDYKSGLATARRVLGYCQRRHNYYYQDDLLTVLKSILIEQQQNKALADLYRKDYPAEWARVAREEPGVYYQLKAAFAEGDGLPDSAQYYYRLAGAQMRRDRRSAGFQAFFYRRWGQALLRFGNMRAALPVLDSALHSAATIRYLPYMAELSHLLDSCQASSGDTLAAYRYGRLNDQYSEALIQANQQDQVLMLDLEAEIKMRELLVQQEDARTEHRHNIQYYTITLLIGICLAILVMLGVFQVPRWLITAMGFFTFIFLFEFIILLIDHKLHALTHGEPWKIIGIKIIIIAGLLPFHHWLEHKVVHYLHHHHLMAGARRRIGPIMQRMRGIAKRSVPLKAVPAATPPPKKPQ